MKIIKKVYELRTDEYLVTVDHPDATYYTVFFKGKEIKDVRGLIRLGGHDTIIPKTKKIRRKSIRRKW